MLKWPRLRDIFSFRPPSAPEDFSAFGSLDETQAPVTMGSSSASPAEVHRQKIRFDNGIRLWIAVPTYLACLALWLGKVTPSILPMTGVFGVYGILQFLASWLLLAKHRTRLLELTLCTMDLLAMSTAVYFTGGPTSPLYFIYFIPMIIHAFHRDWFLILFNGGGGIVCYATAVSLSLTEINPTVLTDLGSRLFFMMLTISIALLSLNLLRKQDQQDKLRIGRLKALSLIGEKLNQLSTLNDLSAVVGSIVKLITAGLGDSPRAWSRVLLTENDSNRMRAIEDPAETRPDLKQEISSSSCPAMRDNHLFYLGDSKTGVECPVEKFSFGAHICVPITGSENESFGVVFAGSPATRAFRRGDREFLTFVARSIGLSIQRLQRMEELRRAMEMNSCVMAIFIASSRSLTATHRAVLEGLLTILKVDQVSLFLWDPAAGKLRCHDANGPRAMDERGLSVAPGEGLPGKVFESGETYWTMDLGTDAVYGNKQGLFKSCLGLPLKNVKGEKLGVIMASRIERPGKFSLVEIDIATMFCTRAALSIENAQAHENERLDPPHRQAA